MATPEEVGGSGESQQVPNGSLSSQTVRERLRRSESEENAEETFAAGLGSGNKKLRLAVRTVIGVLLFLVVLGCVVFSKLSLVALADRLRHVTVNRTKKQLAEKSADIAQVYWQLVVILILPHCLTFVRSAVVGVIGKTNRAYPWPKRSALIAGAVTSVLEVVAMSVFLFSVLCHLSPEVALLSMQPVFAAQFALDIWYTPCSSKCSSQQQRHQTRQRNRSYEDIDDDGERLNSYTGGGGHNEEDAFIATEVPVEKFRLKIHRIFGTVLENKITKAVALFLQVAGVVGFLVLVYLKAKRNQDHLVPVIALPLSVATLAVLWSNKVQEFLLVPQRDLECETEKAASNARYKANFLNSLYRILLYPLLGYAVFRTIHYSKDIDPWTDSRHQFLGTGSDLSFFLTHVLTSFVGYVFAWTACLMTLRTIGFGLPLLLSTPVALIFRRYVSFLGDAPRDQFLEHANLYFAVLAAWFVVYLGQILGMGFYLCTKNNLILSQDKDMFINPHYESVFLEQYLSLNRQVDKYSKVATVTVDGQLSASRAIFICSTMYRENVREMRQMLKSIGRMAGWYADQERWRGNRVYDLVESHIFFDGAVNGGQLTQYALQLLSLVPDCLGVEVTHCLRKQTHYGQSISWDVGLCSMKFTVHFKDNLKIKNKKRWSQVMYMNYVINHRIPESQGTDTPLDKDNTFILTTDADIDFTAESAMVLLDSLASDKEVGAVCARTHPKGSGILYWYQIFDYAIGHWFIKPAEHLFGSVLCCPGCFSVFRCRALEGVLKEYSSEVQGAADFLTKDMGEDRWLCTLLIQKGWRLDYCAISEDHTYCPEAFDEFYKQRRRWVPSTIANLLLLISKSGKITNANNSVSIPFVIFQTIMAFSTAISPATVILIIASGLQGAYQIDEGGVIATIVVLSLLSVFYGIVCLYTSQKTQIDFAKILTFLFAIIMSVVFVGIFKQIILEVFPVDSGFRLLEPPICGNGSGADCLRAQNNLGITLNMSESSKSFVLPTNPTSWYIVLFAVTYTVAAVLHLWEFTCLAHSIWYMLGLPSGYLLLLIYSAVNLDSQSWGTREATASKSGGGGGGFYMVKRWVKEGLRGAREFLLLCCGKGGRDGGGVEQETPLLQEERGVEREEVEYTAVDVEHRRMSEDARQWLKDHECLEYEDNFEQHGYWSLSYIASMRKKDFIAIGIEKQGFVLRLEKAAKKLPAMAIETDVPSTVTEWLRTLEMEEYTEVFHAAGYKTEVDVENLKEIDEKELRRMGIVKIAHVQRLKKALESLFHPSAEEIQIHKVKRYLSQIPAVPNPDREADFWQNIVNRELKPVTVRLQQASKEIGQKLKALRNSTLALMLLINIMWIILLYTVTLPQLLKYGLPERAFQLLFLAVYGFIVMVSFVAMLAHRFLMLIQYLGRPEVVKQAVRRPHDEMVLLEATLRR